MPATIPEDPDTLLTRSEMVGALNHLGFKTTVATQATLASRGGGPTFELWGRKPLYRWGASLAWARNRLRPPRRSTSEAGLIELLENPEGCLKNRRHSSAGAQEGRDD